MSNCTNLSLNNVVQRIARAFSKHKSFDMGRLYLAAVIDDIASGRDENLRDVKTVSIDLGVSE
jgi:hypothetical protein